MKTQRRGRPVRLVLPLLLCASLRPGSGQLVGPEFQVNTITAFTQRHSSVAADEEGNFVVVWGMSQDGSSYGVFGQRFSSSGSPLGGEFLINTYTSGSQRDPAVAAAGPGTMVVVWESGGQDGSEFGVFGQRFDATGGPLGGEFQVNSYTTGYQQEPKVAVDAAGNFVVVWHSLGQDGSGAGIFGQRFDSGGSPVGSEFQVNTSTAEYEAHPEVAIDSSGSFVVVWSSFVEEPRDLEVFGQGFSSDGTPAGNEFQVNTYTTDYQFAPAIAARGSENFVVVWVSRNQDGEDDGVFGRLIDLPGLNAGPEFQINSHTPEFQSSPSVAADNSGNFVVAWSSRLQVASNSRSDIFGQRFDLAGSPLASEFRINTYTTGYQQPPAVTVDGLGNFVVAWDSEGQDGSGWGVFGQRLASDWIFSGTFEAGEVCAWSSSEGGSPCP